MSKLPDSYLLYPLRGEHAVKTDTGRWQWMSVHDLNGRVHSHRYYHLDCDCVTDDDGRCLLCHAKPWRS